MRSRAGQLASIPCSARYFARPFIHPVGQPQQRQFPQCGQVAQPEVVGQRGVDLVGRIDLAVAQSLPQQFR